MPANNIFADALRLAIRQSMLTWAEKTRNDAVENAPRKTGDLRENIRVEPITENGSTFQISVSSNSPHAGYVEFGTRKHPIDARNAKNLVFFWEKKGKLFVGPHVNHPGAKEQPYLNPAAEKNKPEFVQNLTAAFGRAVVESIDYAFKKAQK